MKPTPLASPVPIPVPTLAEMLAALKFPSATLVLLPVVLLQPSLPSTEGSTNVVGSPLAPPTPAVSPSEPAGARKPVRSPKAGSVRETVYQTLEGKNILRRKEIVEEVARRRAITIDARLQGQVGAVLDNAWDPQIERVAFGQYRWKTLPANSTH